MEPPIRNLSGKERFRVKYRKELEDEAEWLRRGAVEKANTIEHFIKRNKLPSQNIIEFGCGTGAVLKECQRRNLGENYFAVDYSQEAIDYLKRTSKKIEAISADITDEDFPASKTTTFDIAILSHVLEHLEEPLDFLEQLTGKLRYSALIIEVPLEDLLASRLKNLFRDRNRNQAGHVQFFTRESFERVIDQAGLKIGDSRTYVPILDRDTVKFLAQKGSFSVAKALATQIINSYLPRISRRIWQKYYYAHYGVLCLNKSNTSCSEKVSFG